MPLCLVGVTEAFLPYMQKEVVRFHYWVQNKLLRTNWLSRYPFKVEIAGSSPVGSTIGVEAEWLSD